MDKPYRISSINLKGYRPFRDFSATFDNLEVIVGANGTGKTTLFQFLRFLRDGVQGSIPTELVRDTIGLQIFHVPGPEKFSWQINIETGLPNHLSYQGEVQEPIGRSFFTYEKVELDRDPEPPYYNKFLFIDVKRQRGVIRDQENRKLVPFEQDVELNNPIQFVLSTINNPKFKTLYMLKTYIEGWRFFNSFTIDEAKIRNPAVIEQNPTLHEDCGNLSAVLSYLKLEHDEIFDNLQHLLRLIIPRFERFIIRQQGRGQVMAYWQEEGMGPEPRLTLADLSEGTKRLVCWLVLCLQPNLPTLICLDEPELGVHPNVIPILAGVLEKAAERTQVFIATHSSYLLTQFDLEKIAVMRKDNTNNVIYSKPADSGYLRDSLEEFGVAELELLHRNQELEQAPNAN